MLYWTLARRFPFHGGRSQHVGCMMGRQTVHMPRRTAGYDTESTDRVSAAPCDEVGRDGSRAAGGIIGESTVSSNLRPVTAPRLLCFSIGSVLLAYGLACALDPAYISAPSGLQAPGTAAIELRATYGGVQMGFGLLCLWGAWSRPALGGVLLAMSLVFAVIAAVRAAAMLAAGAAPAFHIGALAFEAVTAVLAVLALRRVTRS